MAAHREITNLTAQLSTLLNRQLQQICQANGLSKNGVKAELQRRIVNGKLEDFSSQAFVCPLPSITVALQHFLLFLSCTSFPSSAAVLKASDCLQSISYPRTSHLAPS
jgi:hypothetical protein